MPANLLCLHSRDNVAVALSDLPAGATVALPGSPSLTLHDALPFGHKVALTAIPLGGSVVKYGETIGQATKPIVPGDHVHVHNLDSTRAQLDTPFQPLNPQPHHSPLITRHSPLGGWHGHLARAFADAFVGALARRQCHPADTQPIGKRPPDHSPLTTHHSPLTTRHSLLIVVLGPAELFVRLAEAEALEGLLPVGWPRQGA